MVVVGPGGVVDVVVVGATVVVVGGGGPARACQSGDLAAASFTSRASVLAAGRNPYSPLPWGPLASRKRMRVPSGE